MGSNLKNHELLYVVERNFKIKSMTLSKRNNMKRRRRQEALSQQQ